MKKLLITPEITFEYLVLNYLLELTGEISAPADDFDYIINNNLQTDFILYLGEHIINLLYDPQYKTQMKKDIQEFENEAQSETERMKKEQESQLKNNTDAAGNAM